MMTLFMTVCLIASPDRCKEERVMIAEHSVTPMQCMHASMPMIARWRGEHIAWRVVKWKCQTERPGKDA